MNFIELGIWAFVVLTLGACALLGLLRGWRRATLRISLVVVSILFAILLKNWLTNLVLSIKIINGDGTALTLQQLIINAFPAEVQKAGEAIVIPLVRSMMSVVSFLVLFSLFSLFTWTVVFPICNIFVKPKVVVDANGVPQKDANGKEVREKGELIGCAVGAGQGLVIALCICIPLVGLLVQTNRVITLVNDLEQTQQTAYVAQSHNVLAFAEDAPQSAPENVPAESGSAPADVDVLQEMQALLTDFENTAASKFFYGACRPMFDALSTVKVQNADGTMKKVVLSKQITAIKDAVEIAKPLLDNREQIIEQLQNIQSSTGTDTVSKLKDLTAEGSPLKEALAELDTTKGNLSAEQKEMVNDLMVTVVDSISLGENEAAQGLIDSFNEVLDETDFTEVSFSGELDVVDSLTGTLETIQNGEELKTEDVSQVITEVSESIVVLPVLQDVSSDIKLDLTEEQKAQVQDVIDQLPPETDQETLDLLKNLLGM